MVSAELTTSTRPYSRAGLSDGGRTPSAKDPPVQGLQRAGPYLAFTVQREYTLNSL